MTSDAGRPVLRVVHGGEPSAEEVAALVTALAVVSGRAGDSAATPAQPSGWADRRSTMRSPLPRGPGAWRASGRVRGTRTRAGW